MTIRNTKQDSLDATSGEDEEYNDGNSTNNDVNNNYHARTVAFAGAVRDLTGTTVDTDSDDFEPRSRRNGKNISPAVAPENIRSSSILRDSNYVSSDRNTVTWTDYNTDEDRNLDGWDSKSFATRSSGATSATPASVNSEIVMKNLEKMEMKMMALQKEVGNVQKELSAEMETFVRRKSNMVRTSLILRDVNFSASSDELEGSDSHYPTDCYSLIALNGPCGGKWPLKKMKFFFFGVTVFSFQISFLVMMLLSRSNKNASDIEIDNPIPHFLQFIPSNSKEVIRVSQIITLLAYTVFPDASLMDVFRSYQYWPAFSKATKDDPVHCMVISCVLRAFQGYLATMAVFLVVITTPSVVDIILNFTALSFISSLDDEAFALLKSGAFGSDLRKEVERVVEAKLPPCFAPKDTLRLYWKVMGSTGLFLFSLLLCVIGFQNSASWWVTQHLRVEFLKGTGLDQYSGCYSINRDLKFTNRFAYTNIDIAENGESVNGFAYCAETRRWNFFRDFEVDLDPCNAASKELVRSIQTDFFDIAKLFEGLWSYPLSTTPVDLFFFKKETNDYLNCAMLLGNGICDEPFNIPGYNYDEGDCCGATCNHPDCGYHAYEDYKNALFGTNVSGNGYPSCQNPDMKPITVYLNDIVSSRDPKFELNENSACLLDISKGEEEWRAVEPENSLFFLRCDGVYFLTFNVDESMKNSEETVWVEDGTKCAVGAYDTTRISLAGKDTDSYAFYCEDPIWFVNYTIYHGTVEDQVEILTQHTSEVSREQFRTIPQCYFDRLESFVEITSIYSTSNPSHRVVSWLLDGTVPCSSNTFTERFALSTMVFEMNGNETLMDNTRHQCLWISWITCDDLGFTEGIDLQGSSLQGQIPKELVLLTSLKELNLCKCRFDIEARKGHEIAGNAPNTFLFSSFEKKDDNQVTSIPSEIGQVTSLEKLWLRESKKQIQKGLISV